jgi:imidazolonepropionase-like amidohydrolase
MTGTVNHRILCGTLLTMTGDEPEGPQVIEVEGDIIRRVYPVNESGVDLGVTIDLSHSTVMPGLIDAHTHLEMIDILKGDEPAQLSAPDHVLSLRCAANALRNLRHGITTLRLPGTKNFIDVDLRRMFNAGELPGPNLVVAGMGLMSSVSPAVNSINADGVFEVVRAVRRNLAQDVDFIKLFATGPTGPSSYGRGLPFYSSDEIRAAVDVANEFGKPVSAHAYGGVAIDYCLSAGVSHIEHGTLMTSDQYDRLAESGTWLVGTVSVFLAEPGLAELPSMTADQRDRLLWAREEQRKGIKDVVRSGVKFALGTDGIHGPGLAREAQLAASAGLSSRQALESITASAARICGLEPAGGIIQGGARADIIAVAGDPLIDLSVLESPHFVMKDGVRYL